MKSSGSTLVGKELHKKMSSLKEVGGENWVIYYLEENGSKWCKYWPNAEYHGGGAPELKEIERFPWES